MNSQTTLPATQPADPPIPIKPTKETYDRLQQAYEHFNKALFGGTLPNALITLQRRKGTFGYLPVRDSGTRMAARPTRSP